MNSAQNTNVVEPGAGTLPWGTHACRFYESRDDLVDTLIPYFVAGLRRNEACLWVAAGPVGADEARALMAAAMPEFDACLRKGQIEIRDAAEWYAPGTRFDTIDVLEAWTDREQRALRGGYAGLRLAGDTSWLERSSWDNFLEYEHAVGELFHRKRVIGLCTYCARRHTAEDLHEIAHRHDFVLTGGGGLDLLDDPARAGVRGTSQAAGAAPATLRDVLYAGRSQAAPPESDWVALVRRIGSRDQLALHALYERIHRPVYTLAVRITGSREAAEEVTLDVFHDAWRRASSYDPANGTVIGWIMNLARSRAIDRVRFEQRRKRADSGAADAGADMEPCTTHDALDLAGQTRAVQAAMAVLTPDER